jgi:multimeric flavodoxin WrbA
MNEIYPLWVEAHGVLLLTPVHWYQATSPLKLMMDRMVCADGGNPDSTRTQGKKVELAKEIELQGWDYPKHLKGRIFGVVVHGGAEGVAHVRHALADWLVSMEFVPAGGPALIDRYVGYWTPYATSHSDLDRDEALQEEVRNAARTVLEAVKLARAGGTIGAGQELEAPREK